MQRAVRCLVVLLLNHRNRSFIYAGNGLYSECNWQKIGSSVAKNNKQVSLLVISAHDLLALMRPENIKSIMHYGANSNSSVERQFNKLVENTNRNKSCWNLIVSKAKQTFKLKKKKN